MVPFGSVWFRLVRFRSVPFDLVGFGLVWLWFGFPGSEEIVPVPSMGDSITEGTIVEWAKQPGDSVEVDEVVVVLETDKVRYGTVRYVNMVR